MHKNISAINRFGGTVKYLSSISCERVDDIYFMYEGNRSQITGIIDRVSGAAQLVSLLFSCCGAKLFQSVLSWVTEITLFNGKMQF